MEMKRREVRNLGERLQIQELIQMLIDVLRDTVHAIDVQMAASGSIHRYRGVRSFSRRRPIQCNRCSWPLPCGFLLAVENHLRTAKYRQRPAGLLVRHDRIPYLGGLAAM